MSQTHQSNHASNRRDSASVSVLGVGRRCRLWGGRGRVVGQWLALLPQKWNATHQLLYGWRYDPREFAAAPTERDERRRDATRATE